MSGFLERGASVMKYRASFLDVSLAVVSSFKKPSQTRSNQGERESLQTVSWKTTRIRESGHPLPPQL